MSRTVVKCLSTCEHFLEAEEVNTVIHIWREQKSIAFSRLNANLSYERVGKNANFGL